MDQQAQLKGGIDKIIDKGTQDPTAVRFHVPKGQGQWRQVTWGQVLHNSRHIHTCRQPQVG